MKCFDIRDFIIFRYILDEVNDVIKDLISTLILKCENSFVMNPCDDFHISVTKTVILRHHWIDSFVETVTQSVSHIRPYVFIILVCIFS